MFFDSDIKSELGIKKKEPEEVKPYKPPNKKIFIGYKETKKKKSTKKK